MNTIGTTVGVGGTVGEGEAWPFQIKPFARPLSVNCRQQYFTRSKLDTALYPTDHIQPSPFAPVVRINLPFVTGYLLSFNRQHHSLRSKTFTSLGWPFNSKKTVRVPSSRGSPTVRKRMINTLPGSISTLISSPLCRP